MSDTVGSEEVRPQYADEQAELSPIEAFRAINRREEPAAEGGEEAEINDRATPHAEEHGDDGADHEEFADEADAGVDTEDQLTSGDDGQEDTVDEDLPPISPPRSWTKEEQAAWATLPRDVQETISERERARGADIDRRLNEAAKQMQAAQAREQAAEQARKSYEDQLPNLLQAMSTQYNQQFADVQSWDDVQKMAQEDPVRFNLWQAMQAQSKAVQEEVQAAQTRQKQQEQQQAREFYMNESQRFLEKAPEFADPKQSQTLWNQAFETLTDVGFSSDEVNEAWNAGGAIPVHDHRFQLLVRDAMLYRNAKKTVKKAPQKTPPARNVQRPGPAPDKGQERSDHVKRLEDRLSRTGSRRDALSLLKATRG